MLTFGDIGGSKNRDSTVNNVLGELAYLMTSFSQFLTKLSLKHIMTSSKHRKHDKVCARANWKNCKEHQRPKRGHIAGWIEVHSRRLDICSKTLAWHNYALVVTQRTPVVGSVSILFENIDSCFTRRWRLFFIGQFLALPNQSFSALGFH